MAMTSVKEVELALSPMSEALEVDGYRLEVLGVGETLNLKLSPLKNACPDCLVPAKQMAMMISARLDGAYDVEAVSIEYPNARSH